MDRQAGLAYRGAFDDSAQLAAVLSGECGWKASVAGCSVAGQHLVRHGDEVVGALSGSIQIPRSDVVHGDYSSANMIITDHGDTWFVDCETIGRGCRVRDLADLCRQCFVYPGAPAAALDLLRDHACAVTGPEVFAICVVAVSYNNLAWWVEHKTRAEFDAACHRVHELFEVVGSRCR